jgi:hypothetical protein
LYVIGKPITLVKAYDFAGVDSTTGSYQFLNSQGAKTFYPGFSTDRTILINTSPKYYGGFENSIRYKKVQLSFMLQFVKQVGLNDYHFGIGNPGYFFGGNYNQPTSVLSRWQKAGDVTTIQRYNMDFSINDQFSYAASSNAAYEDASYLRLKNLSLSWQLLDKWKSKMGLQGCNMYLQCQNLFTITKYKGLDPETLTSTSLPPLTVWTIGAQIVF